MEWISWQEHPVPDDVRGILIKYDDGVFPDRYDEATKKRKYRVGKDILGWRWMERSDPNKKSIQCASEERGEEVMDIDSLELSVRSSNVLRNMGIKDTHELIKYTPGNLAMQRNWGKRCLAELREKLLIHGLCLAGDTIVSSAHGIELIKEIPQHLEKIKEELHKVFIEVRDVLDMIEKIRISSTTWKE